MTGQPQQHAEEGDVLPELHAQVGSRLAQQGHRYSKGRRELVEVLIRAERPMTLPDIVAAEPELAQSSAYRNLDVLFRCGIIRRINAAIDRAHFELAESLMGHHHHLICINCGTIEDVHLDSEVELLVDQSLSNIASQSGFTPIHHSLDLHGHCADC